MGLTQMSRRSPGFGSGAVGAFPMLAHQWRCAVGLAVHSCGGSAGMAQMSVTGFPLLDGVKLSRSGRGSQCELEAWNRWHGCTLFGRLLERSFQKNLIPRRKAEHYGGYRPSRSHGETRDRRLRFGRILTDVAPGPPARNREKATTLKANSALMADGIEGFMIASSPRAG